VVGRRGWPLAAEKMAENGPVPQPCKQSMCCFGPTLGLLTVVVVTARGGRRVGGAEGASGGSGSPEKWPKNTRKSARNSHSNRAGLQLGLVVSRGLGRFLGVFSVEIN